jgi:hypothetical protein
MVTAMMTTVFTRIMLLRGEMITTVEVEVMLET